jgi:hypothetical protein
MSLVSEAMGFPPGTYRLSVTLPPLAKDGRRHSDWRYLPLLRGTLFIYTEHFEDHKVQGKRKPVTIVQRWLRPVGKLMAIDPFTSRYFNARDLVAALVPVEETPSMYLRREHNVTPSTATHLIDLLAEQGKLTLDEVKKMAGTVHEESE